MLKIVDACINDGKATTIVDAITTYLVSVELDIDRLASIASDGTSIMTGRRGGVAALLHF